MKYTDPFLGEIELTELGFTSRHGLGEHIIDTIYIDAWGNYYIETWTTTGGDIRPMMFLRKSLIEKINELSQSDNPASEDKPCNAPAIF